MSWLRFDDTFPDHPKVLRAGTDAPLVIALQVRAVAYASRHLTDGFIPHAFVQLATNDLDEITTCGNCDGNAQYKSDRWGDLMLSLNLWEKCDGGFIIHDYLHYNPSKREIAKNKKQRELASRKGGAATKAAWGAETRPGRPRSRPTLRRGPVPSPPVPSQDPKEDPPYPPKGGTECADCVAVLQELATLTGKLYPLNAAGFYEGGLHERHQEHGRELCLQVVRISGARLWRSEEPKYRAFCRPSTLFGRKNFRKYLEEVQLADAQRPEDDIPESFDAFLKQREGAASGKP